MWLSPEQGRVLPITDGHAEGARAIADRLQAAGLRVDLDDRSDTLSYRIRDGEVMKVPYLLVVGDRELEAGTVAVRAHGAEKKQVVMPVDDFVDAVQEKVRSKGLDPALEVL